MNATVKDLKFCVEKTEKIGSDYVILATAKIYFYEREEPLVCKIAVKENDSHMSEMECNVEGNDELKKEWGSKIVTALHLYFRDLENGDADIEEIISFINSQTT